MLATGILACLLVGADPKPSEAATPRLVTLSVVDGKAAVEVWRSQRVKSKLYDPSKKLDGKGSQEEKEGEVTAWFLDPVPLSKVKELTITTAGGKKLTVEEAEKHIADGAVVVVSTDGKPVDAKFLKLFRNNVLILVSPEFVEYNRRRDT